MIFKIKFIWTDPSFIRPKMEWLPVEATDRNEAISIFNKFIGVPFGYVITDISVLDYE